MTLDACEFIRRFLLHVLPHGFWKIRYYGFLSNRKRQRALARCRAALNVVEPAVDSTPKAWEEVLRDLTGIDIRVCPSCHTGRMRVHRHLEPAQRAGP